MATRNNSVSHVTNNGDAKSLREQTDMVSGVAAELERLTGQVHERHAAQIRAIEETVSRTNETIASLKETVTHAASVAGSAEQLTSAINEMAASGEQVKGNTSRLNEMLVGTVTAI